MQVLREICELWDCTQWIQFNDEAHDTVKWKWTLDGTDSAATAYPVQFEGNLRSNDKL